MVALYTRVSTVGQEDGYSLDNQLKDGIAFAQSKGQEYKHFQDVASGGDITREGILALQASLIKDGYSFLWVAKEDRLSRDTIEGLTILNLLKAVGTQLYIGQAYYDVNNSNTEFILTILWGKAKKEKSDIKERVIKNKKSEIDSGNRAFPTCYGYVFEFTPTGKRLVKEDPKEVEIVRKIFNLYESGTSLMGIAKQLNALGIPTKKKGLILGKGKTGKMQGKEVGVRWNTITIARILTRVEYLGVTKDTSGNLIPSRYPAIIEQGQFDRVNIRLNGRRQVKETNGIREATHLLTGLIKCSVCGEGYYYHKETPSKKNNFKPRISYSHLSTSLKTCPNPLKSVRYPDIEWMITDIYQNLVYDKDDFAEFLKSEKSRVLASIADLDTAIGNLSKDLKKELEGRGRLITAIINGTFSEEEVRPQKVALDKKIEELTSNIENAIKEKGYLMTHESENLLALQNEEFASFQKLSDVEKRQVLAKRLKMEVRGSRLYITSILGTEYTLEIDDYLKKSNLIKKEIINQFLEDRRIEEEVEAFEGQSTNEETRTLTKEQALQRYPQLREHIRQFFSLGYLKHFGTKLPHTWVNTVGGWEQP